MRACTAEHPMYLRAVGLEAPGSDIYSMSTTCCYADMGVSRRALRYPERAGKIGAGNGR
ncbi:MAG: hypothetical protein AB1714_04905 [Acidobacteriota bacterium]